MRKRYAIRCYPLVFAVVLAFSVILPGSLSAHCDGMDGPVVTAAKKALDKEDVILVLIWVREEDEDTIKTAFQKTLKVRKLNPEAKELADMYFFETLVRIHRDGEGAPYTGLKPAGRDIGPAIPAADRAIIDGKLEPLIRLVTAKIHSGINQQFQEIMGKKSFHKNDVKAGREYLETYVSFIHYVERLYQAADQAVQGHFPEIEKQ